MKKHKRVLIVDDDVDMCKTWKAILDEKGYNVKTINYGYLAFIELKNHDYDLVFMDIKLTGIDGVKIYKELKGVKPDLKVVIVTGCAIHEISELVKEGKEHGMIEEYLRKPVDPDRLIEIIEKYTN